MVWENKDLDFLLVVLLLLYYIEPGKKAGYRGSELRIHFHNFLISSFVVTIYLN